MSSFDPGVYLKILRVRDAWPFDLGCFFMRVYGYMGTLGVVSMLTFSGHTALFAGTVASMLAISTFFIGPRIGKLMDERGQSHVVAIASLITLLGIALLLIAVSFNLPEWLMYPAAFLMGFIPSAPAIARTRWTYLLETGQLGDNPPELKSVFSYEGIIEDAGFMIGPALAITLASLLFPAAGLLTGALLFITGNAILLLGAKATTPIVGWKKQSEDEIAQPEEKEERPRIALVDLPVVRLLFSLSLLIGLFFGALDTTSIPFAEALGDPTVASVGVSVASFISMIAGFIFGMMSFKTAMHKQLITAAILCGLGYSGMALIGSAAGFYAVSWIGALFYPPLVILVNSFCERVVPANRLTESLTWVSAGTMCGFAISPTLCGALIDAISPTAGFTLGSIACLSLVLLAVVFKPLLKKAEQSI